MATSPITGTGSGTSNSASATNRKSLNSDDFIQMMITQLQHQDPLQPASNQELMAQMSQIGQLQSTTQLQTTLSGLALQNQIGAGANLMGKMVTGVNQDGDDVQGIVTAVKVAGGQVSLELHNGKTLGLSSVMSISEPADAAAATAAS